MKDFFAPHMTRLLGKWRCDECGAGVEPGMSFVSGRRVGLCMKCVKDIKEATRP